VLGLEFDGFLEVRQGCLVVAQIELGHALVKRLTGVEVEQASGAGAQAGTREGQKEKSQGENPSAAVNQMRPCS
jgi:hypothetical protein